MVFLSYFCLRYCFFLQRNTQNIFSSSSSFSTLGPKWVAILDNLYGRFHSGREITYLKWFLVLFYGRAYFSSISLNSPHHLHPTHSRSHHPTHSPSQPTTHFPSRHPTHHSSHQHTCHSLYTTHHPTHQHRAARCQGSSGCSAEDARPGGPSPPLCSA